MGDRAIITLKSGKEYGPMIYIHSFGSEVIDLIQNAAGGMRKGDVSYASARLCGYLHEQIKGPLGLGIFGTPDLTEDGNIDMSKVSPGDAGVIVVDIDTGEIKAYEGYLAKESFSSITNFCDA